MNHTLGFLGLAHMKMPRLVRATIRHNLYGCPSPGKGNRARRRIGMHVAERVFGKGWTHGMTVGEFNQWFRIK